MFSGHKIVKMHTRILLGMLMSFSIILFGNVYSQSAILSGKVISDQTGEILIGANVYNQQAHSITDFNGQFIIQAQIGDTLIFSYLSFESFQLPVFAETLERGSLEIMMKPSSMILQTATVTGSRFEKRLSESTVSVEVIKPQLIENTNTVRVDEVLNKVPGVQMIDGQANIRGGSGFSYGAGSRVMLLIDDMPALQADAGFPNWNDIPVENIGQIEVLKGAASALYGSSALNGIINIRTGLVTSTPVTKISVGYTHFMDPSDQRKKWWDGERSPYGINASIVHRRRVNKWDLTATGFYRKLESFNQDTYEDRQRISFNAKYRASDRLNAGINTLVNHSQSGDFFIWANPVTGAMQPYPNNSSVRENLRIIIDPYVTYHDGRGGRHRWQNRYFYIDNQNNMNQSNSSQMMYSEYQYQNRLSAINVDFTGGALISQTWSEAELFGDTTFFSTNAAIYGQLDRKFSEQFNIAVGARYEFNRQRSPAEFMGQQVGQNGVVKDGRTIFRVGANYKLNEYSSVRASWGQGYRFPTITERFITTEFSGFRIFPNVNLIPETGWSAELAIKQGVRILGFEGFLDFALFHQEYRDMMEFTLVNLGQVGFQSQNIGNTVIRGLEISTYGRAKLLGIPIQLFGGYTYMDPYYSEFTEAIKGASSVDENVLKYRARHNFKMDAEAILESLNVGFSVQRTSHMIAIDAALGLLPGAGIEQYRAVNNQGFYVFDARVGYKINQWKVSLLGNNILNKEYTLRPALMEAPRNLSVRFDYSI